MKAPLYTFTAPAAVLMLGSIVSTPTIAYDFDKMHQRFNTNMSETYQALQESYESRRYASTSSMRYFDEKNNAYVIKIRTILPKEALDIEMHNKHLVITGKTQNEHTTHHFSNTMSLPKYADSANISARFENQILTITIPKTVPKKPQPKKITIN